MESFSGNCGLQKLGSLSLAEPWKRIRIAFSMHTGGVSIWARNEKLVLAQEEMYTSWK